MKKQSKNKFKNQKINWIFPKNGILNGKFFFKMGKFFFKMGKFPKNSPKIPNGILNGKVSMSITVDSVF